MYEDGHFLVPGYETPLPTEPLPPFARSFREQPVEAEEEEEEEEEELFEDVTEDDPVDLAMRIANADRMEMDGEDEEEEEEIVYQSLNSHSARASVFSINYWQPKADSGTCGQITIPSPSSERAKYRTTILDPSPRRRSPTSSSRRLTESTVFRQQSRFRRSARRIDLVHVERSREQHSACKRQSIVRILTQHPSFRHDRSRIPTASSSTLVELAIRKPSSFAAIASSFKRIEFLLSFVQSIRQRERRESSSATTDDSRKYAQRARRRDDGEWRRGRRVGFIALCE